MFHFTHHSDMDAPSMYTLMYFQIFYKPVGVITHITGVWTLQRMQCRIQGTRWLPAQESSATALFPWL